MTTQAPNLFQEIFRSGRLIDLSMPLGPRLPVYPGDPPFEKSWHCALDRDGFNLSLLHLGAHSGTHLDAPFHFLGEGSDVAALPLERFCGPAVAIDVPKAPGENVSLDDLRDTELHPGEIVLFRTGWEARAGSPAYFSEPWPGLAPDLVDWLIGQGIRAVGGDFPSVESPAAVAAGAPVHRALARAGLPVFECLVNLSAVAGRRFVFFGFPLKIAGGEASPIRAVALLM